jgi:hypothetical protein
MRRRVLAGLGAVLLALASVTAAGAHQGHGSCAGGAPGAIETVGGIPTGPGRGPSGPEFVAPAARSGQAATVVETLHAVYCEPRP